MLGKLKSVETRLLMRRCVNCGYDGALLRGGQASRCARCGCDLRKRPARSYAEMEGLVGHPLQHEPATPKRGDEKLIHRWLTFLFVSMLGIMAIAYLISASVQL
jgi:hypothetical protein